MSTMSTKLFKKSSRNGLSMNDDKTKNKDLLKKDAKDVETKFQKEAEKKKTTIDWEEEKDVLKKFIHQEYPLITNTKLNKIIDERNEKYIDFTKYKSFFLKFQASNLVENIKKITNGEGNKKEPKYSTKLSNAPDNIKQYFLDQAKEISRHKANKDQYLDNLPKQNLYSSSEEDENDDVNNNESDKSQSDTEKEEDDDSKVRKNNETDKSQIDTEGEDENSNKIRKRKCEYSAIDETTPKSKKDIPVLRWLPNGNKVSRNR